MVVTAESPPEPLERPLALCSVPPCPAGAELGPLLEGYGLFVADTPDPDPELRDDGPAALRGRRRRARLGHGPVLRPLPGGPRPGGPSSSQFLSSAQPGRLDAAAQQVYGTGAAALEEAWRPSSTPVPPTSRPGSSCASPPATCAPTSGARWRCSSTCCSASPSPSSSRSPSSSCWTRPSRAATSRRCVDILAVLLAGVHRVPARRPARRLPLRLRQRARWCASCAARCSSRCRRCRRPGTPSASRATSSPASSPTSACSNRGCRRRCAAGCRRSSRWSCRPSCCVILNPLLAVITLVGAPIIGAVYKAMAKGAQKRSVAVQEETGSVLTVASENYGAQPVVKAFGLQGRETGRFTPGLGPAVRPPGQAAALRRRVRALGQHDRDRCCACSSWASAPG